MGKVDTTALETLRAQIAELPVRSTVTPFELVQQLAPAIVAARDRGQDFRAIGALLAGIGVRLKPSTIRNYVWRAGRHQTPPVAEARVATSGSPHSALRTSAAPDAPLSPLERARRAAADSGSPLNGRFELVQDKEV